MKKIIFVYFFCFPFLAGAQILNVEKGRQQADSTNRFVGDVAFNFTINNRSATQEDENRLIGVIFNSDLAYISKKHMYLLFSNLNFTYATDDPVIRTGYSHFRTTLFFQKTFAYELFAQIQFDLGRGLQFRQLGGTGIRYNLVENDDLQMALGIGGMWERETWKFPNADQQKTLSLIKSSNYVSVQQKINETANVGATIYFQTGYDNTIEAFRHRVSIDTSLGFTISDVLSFAVSFNGAYENLPVVPILKYMYVLENGIKISF